MSQWKVWLKLALADAVARKRMFFTLTFLALSVFSFVVAHWSNVDVLFLNSFLLIAKTVAVFATVAGRMASLLQHTPASALNQGTIVAGVSQDGHCGSVTLSSSVQPSAHAPEFPLGIYRIEFVVQFASYILLFISCLTCSIEDFHRLFLEPPTEEVHPIFVEFACLLHAVAIIAFSASMDASSSPVRPRSAKSILSVCLFLGKDTTAIFNEGVLPPLICFCATSVTSLTGMQQLDCLGTLLLATICVSLNLEGCKEVVSVIVLQAHPRNELGLAVANLIREATTLVEGVRECKCARYWTLKRSSGGGGEHEKGLLPTTISEDHGNAVVGMFKFTITATADEERVRRELRSRVLWKVFSHVTVELERLGGSAAGFAGNSFTQSSAVVPGRITPTNMMNTGALLKPVQAFQNNPHMFIPPFTISRQE